MKIDHMALYCKDLEGMRGFFEKYFQATSNDMYHNPHTNLRTYILSFPGGETRLELMTRPEVDCGDGYYESCVEGPEGILLEITV